jgi:hypothetical protein
MLWATRATFDCASPVPGDGNALASLAVEVNKASALALTLETRFLRLGNPTLESNCS